VTISSVSVDLSALFDVSLIQDGKFGIGPEVSVFQVLIRLRMEKLENKVYQAKYWNRIEKSFIPEQLLAAN
jgi:hypothetical protein